MDKKAIILLAAVLLVASAGVAFSDSLTDVLNTQNSTLFTEGNAFIQATQAGAGTIPTAFNSVFEAFDPGFCGNDMFSANLSWIGATAAALLALAFALAL